MAASVRHETRALLRAHLSAASSYGHLTRHCPICHRLLRLALDASAPQSPTSRQEGVEDESAPTA
ncbi:Zf-HC2 domain-containing protein OS=Streptomyces tendae OX=1932 GN=GUR47_22045 PE=4 SV=1 [Streptomyces tendae]